MRKGAIGGLCTAIIVFIIVTVTCFCTTKIPAGYVGVVYNLNGGIEQETLSQGWRFTSPTKTVTLYTIAREQSYMSQAEIGDSPNDESFEIPTKEGASLKVDLAFGYSFDPARIPEIFVKFRGQNGQEILSSFIKPNMQGWIKEITPDFGMIEIVSKQRGAVNAAITEEMQKRFATYGIIIDRVSLTDVRPDAETDKAIKAKIKAQEELETAKVTAETAKIAAARDKDVAKIAATKEKEVAEINAEKARIEAQGKADAKLISAKATAEANREIARSLTPELLESQKISKWKGVVPQVQGAGATIVDIGQLSE